MYFQTGILSVIAFFDTTFLLAVGGESEFVQYGALGLLGIVVLFLCKHLSSLTEQHTLERKELVVALAKRESDFIDMIKQDVVSRDRLSEALEDRPCLLGDQRITEEQKRE
jgi:hypothetical protein